MGLDFSLGKMLLDEMPYLVDIEEDPHYDGEGLLIAPVRPLR